MTRTTHTHTTLDHDPLSCQCGDDGRPDWAVDSLTSAEEVQALIDSVKARCSDAAHIQATIKRLNTWNNTTIHGLLFKFMGKGSFTGLELRAALVGLCDSALKAIKRNDDLIELLKDSAESYKRLRDRYDKLYIDMKKELRIRIELPVGADGKVIRINDELETIDDGKSIVVKRLKYSEKHGWMIGGADQDALSDYGLYAPKMLRHHPTVEDVLCEFWQRTYEWYRESGPIDSAGKIAASAAEYAARLRGMMS